jgi:hypothetical protein
VNRPKVEANCCRNSERASELHLGGRGDEEGKGRAPVGVRADGAGSGLQVIPRPILPARTGADQPFGADLVPRGVGHDDGHARPGVVDQQILECRVAQELQRSGAVGGQRGGEPLQVPSGTKAANRSRAAPLISWSSRWSRRTGQRTLSARSRFCQTAATISLIGQVSCSGCSSTRVEAR